jgi:hypothetical protein
MKFQEPSWRFKSPGPLPDGARCQFSGFVERIAAQGRVQDILEEFKWYFSNGTASRSSSESWAQTDLRNNMESAAENAPFFIEAFVKACDDLKQQGLDVPTVEMINEVLWREKAGYRIEGDRLVSHYLGMPATVEREAPEGEPLVVERPKPVAVATPRPSARSEIKSLRLRVFLCHSSGDKAAVQTLYLRLKHFNYDPWLDSVELLPGQDWESEIKRAVKASHVVIACLSQGSVSKAGFVQKEIKFALDVADEQPDDHIFIIPARLEDCAVPDRLRKWQWVDLFEEHGFDKLREALDRRIGQL